MAIFLKELYMNNFIKNKAFFAYLMAAFTTTGHAFFDFEDMERHFQEIHESMERSFDQIRQQMHDSFKNDIMSTPWKVECVDSQDGKSLVVAVIGVATDSVKAQLSDDNMHLTVIVDHGTVSLKSSKNWISIGVKQSQESKKKSKRKSMHSASISSKTTSRTVTQDVDLAEAKVDYNSKDKLLVIAIPYHRQVKKGRVIPVTIDAGMESDASDTDVTADEESDDDYTDADFSIVDQDNIDK